jgi:rifampicin phosphotransferase
VYTIELFLAGITPERIGRKAASLVELHQVGFQVPRGVCVTTAAHRDWLEAGHLTEPVRTALLTAFSTLRAPLAVRSSSPAEDLPQASYAGQYATVLGVESAADMLEAVATCWKSASSGAAAAYRQARGGDLVVDMAVLIQELIPADVAGVMFTMNPVTDRVDQIVINANFGLGESVVSGHAEPDTFILSKETKLTTEATLGSKRVFTQLKAGGVAEQSLEPGRQERFSLSDEQRLLLADAALALEAHYDCPMDAEWAFVGNTLHMLQARPVTTGRVAYFANLLDQWARDRGIGSDPEKMWVRGSVLSGLRVSPLYYSEMSAFFADMFVAIGRLHRAPPLRRKVFCYYNGFVYTDAEFSSTADPPGVIKSESPFSPAWTSNLRIALRHPWSLAFWANIDYYNLRWQQVWRPGIEAHRPPLDTATPIEIRQFIEYLEVQRRERSIVAGLAVGYAPNCIGLLTYLLDRWLPGATQEQLGILTSGLPDSLTHEENVALWHLSESATRLPAVNAAIAAGRFDDIAALPGGRGFLDDVDAFRRVHGHRGCSDRDIYQPRWADDRVLLLNQVKLMLSLGPSADPTAAHRHTMNRRIEAEHKLLARLNGLLGPCRRWVLTRVLRATQRYVMHRDNQRHTFEPYFLELRHAYTALGDKLAAQAVLDRPDDVFFLGKSEIYAHMEGTLSTAKLRGRASWRRNWWEKVTLTEPPGYLRGYRPHDPEVSAGVGDAELKGAPGAPGTAKGPVRLVASLAELDRIRPGEIIVTYAIDPAWTPVFGIIGGVISVEGGMLAHAAVLGREYGLPVVLGVKRATSRLKDGDIVQIDGTTGAVSLISVAVALDPRAKDFGVATVSDT